MVRYLIRRIVGSIVLLLVVSAVTFFIFFATPVSPGRLACGKTCTPANVAAINKALGLNKPLTEQYAIYMKHIVTGANFDAGNGAPPIHCGFPCLGVSFHNSATVSSLMAQALPATISIAVGAGILWLVLGVAIGIIAALTRGRLPDKLLMVVSLIFYSVPFYVLGLILELLFVFKWHAIRVPGYNSFLHTPVLWYQGMLLPWLTIALTTSAGYARFMRASMLETLTEDYIRTAKAKGLRTVTVTMRHALRGAITPIVTIFGLDLAYLLGGSVIVEQLFSISGIGLQAIQSINDVDLPVIMATVLIAAVFIVAANVIVDVVYSAIDPRVRLS
jgi:peptide/nickel transport system permease protein